MAHQPEIATAAPDLVPPQQRRLRPTQGADEQDQVVEGVGARRARRSGRNLSDSDAPQGAWATKLGRYDALGVSELVAFSPEATAGSRLRVWDRVDGALRERVVDDDSAPSLPLGLTWLVAPSEGNPVALRIATGSGQLREPKLAKSKTRAREAAEARVRELEVLLKQR